MKKIFTNPKLLLMVLLLVAGTAAKAQVSSLANLNSSTLAVYCPSEAVKLTATSTLATTYTWKRYTGTSATGTATTLTGTTASLVDTPTDPGYYTYVSTGLNADGCESILSDPAVVYVLPGISAAITSNAPLTTQYCVTAIPAGLTLTAVGDKTGATVPETFAYKYQWYKNGVMIPGATTAAYTLNSTSDAVVGTGITYTAKITYVIKACTETTSNGIAFNVVATPGKPTITITP